MTFLACKVTYQIVFLCKLYINKLATKNLWSGDQNFLLVTSWLPNEKVNFEPWYINEIKCNLPVQNVKAHESTKVRIDFELSRVKLQRKVPEGKWKLLQVSRVLSYRSQNYSKYMKQIQGISVMLLELARIWVIEG